MYYVIIVDYYLHDCKMLLTSGLNVTCRKSDDKFSQQSDDQFQREPSVEIQREQETLYDTGSVILKDHPERRVSRDNG